MTGIGSVINVTAIICGGLLELNFGYGPGAGNINGRLRAGRGKERIPQ